MRPTFMGFETATRGLMVNQKALDIVGHNIGNIGVTGYTRQRVDLVSLNVNMRYTRYNTNNTSFAGQGVGAYGVSQIRDSFLDKRFREEYSDVGMYSVHSSVLEDISSALDEITPSTMSTAMSRFQTAWDDMLGKDINETTGASNIVAAAKQVIAAFNQMSSKLDNVWNQQEYSLSLEVDNINSILGRMAELNDAISQQRFNSMDVGNENYQPLELLDQQNVLLDELAQYANIYYETQSDGQVTVWMGTKDENNPPIVEGKKAQTMMMSTNDSDPNFKTVSLYWANTGEEIKTNNTGILQGALDMLNGRGLTADGASGENHAQGIHYYKDKIDQFAKTFVEAFNNVIEYVQGDTDPTPGEPYDPPRYRAMFSFSSDSYEGAGTIQINGAWEKDHSLILQNLKDKVVDEGDQSNTYAAKVSQLFEKDLEFGEYTGKINDYISFYSVTKLGNDKSYADSRLEAVTTISDNILNQIQQISGVSMEEEGVDMMMYKKAYDAASRVFTTLDEMLDKLINSTGVVGR